MSKKTKKILLAMGVLLLINGFGNIIDDERVLTYDLTSIFSGIGFLTLSWKK
jgi:hypothetical protein